MRRRVVRRKPPEGSVSYTESTYERLVTALPEPLTSRMRVNHAMVLNVLGRWQGQQAALHTLLLDNHEEPARREALVERAVQVLASLLRARVIQPDDGSSLQDWLPADAPDPVVAADDPSSPDTGPAHQVTGPDNASGAEGIPQPASDDLGPIGRLLAAAGQQG